jgi:hypothetical protein
VYNLRYHIASLVAVFLALAVGLLLGSVVAEQGMITNQTSSLVDDLEARFDEISATNDQLTVDLERDRVYAEETVAPLVAGKLAAKNVLVVVGTGRVDGVSAVTDTVTKAGGTVAVASLLTPALGLDKAEPEGLAGYLQLRGVTMAEPGEELERQVAEALVGEWRSGQSELTQLLIRDGLLSVESATETKTVDAVVIVGDGKAGSDPVSLEVARAMSAQGGVGVGADSAAVEGGTAALFAAQGISAVDHITSPQGRVSLVWLLSRRAEGYFGFGNGAQGYTPPLSN